MRMKFSAYVEKTHNVPDMNLPLKHSICGIIYTPTNICGEFEACDKKRFFRAK